MSQGAYQKREKPELLAPAGGWEQLEYAIRFGADAVYLAADRFGMRQKACNFPLEQLPRVVAYAHERGVSVHVTCNIVMHERDMTALPAYLEAMDDAGVDALIVGDLGALRLARTYAPHAQLHVSTQASVANAQAALTWYELGARRIVLARELSVDDIATLHAQLPDDLELEAFVHGAMCMAYSGRCMISDYLTGRSALEGHCAQSCRWNYVLEEEKRPGEYFPIEEDAQGTYILNSKDLNMLAHLGDLRAAGVDSFKIEGRNKKAFYVATVVNAYRQVLDGVDPALLAAELETVSHRPYSTGFFYGPAQQTVESTDYLWNCRWAADVVSCEELPRANSGRYLVTVRCRNQFGIKSRLEVLSPQQLPRPLKMVNLEHIPEDWTKVVETEPYPVEVANRAMECYRFWTDDKLAEHDIIRVRVEDADDEQGVNQDACGQN